MAWHPWGAAAFAEAARRDVPVMVSIGYSTCHWCHVMARESFSDPSIAAILDDGFVAVKVDREEHPEVDAAYMAAAAAFSPSLGWPLTVFTTPDGRPFYAGTYFPPEPRSGLPAFAQVLAAVADAWTQRRAQVDGTGAAIVSALAEVRSEAARADGEGALPGEADIAAASTALARLEDTEYGGFGAGDPAAPKFPVATALRFLQDPLVRRAAPETAAVAERALAAMARSPLRDPVDGGFFRYATRRDWTVPHYERMLTDNAQLLEVALDAGSDEVARGVAGFLIDVLQQPSGGFGAAQDSESWIDGTRSEGGYYVRDAAARAALAAPAVDGKIVTGWNGLAIGALARAGARCGEPGWVSAARWAADAVIAQHRTDDGGVRRASLDEIASRAPGTLADHGQLATGLLALAAATGEADYALVARELVDACITDDGTLSAPGGNDEVLAAQGLLAPDAASDADEPSGEASLAEAARGLWMLGAGDRYRVVSTRIVGRRAAAALRAPMSHGTLLRVAAGWVRTPRQLVVVRTDDAAPSSLEQSARLAATDVTVVVTDAQAAAWTAQGFELCAAKSTQEGLTTAYDCRDFVCRLPVTDPAALGT
ncbi:DUF255 domain-containing protein [Microbacterium hominis]|uniref:thioredoxin domain-containing protein n=1 Tax=Microbacterium hominis TaxID=162426 RepID=UPI0020B6C881